MNEALRIKVCGMMDATNLEEVCALSPDYVGFIFVALSPRFVGSEPDPALFRIPGKSILRVGVFVEEREELLLDQLQKDHIDMVQLHGNESPDYCRSLKNRGVTVIKALPSASLETGAQVREWKEAADYLLVDSPSAGQGGSGKKFDWGLLDNADPAHPFFLSGGITREDAGAIRELDHPALYAVDVNSGFEREPGLKDVAILEAFIKELRSE